MSELVGVKKTQSTVYLGDEVDPLNQKFSQYK